MASTAPSGGSPPESPAGRAMASDSSSSLRGRRGRAPLEVDMTVQGEAAVPCRKIYRIAPTERIEDWFYFEEKLYDSERQTQVYRAKCRKTGGDVIVKMRARHFTVNGESVWRSLLTRMLNLETHAHVLGLHDILEDDDRYYIVMERCSGGELFDFLQTETDVPERECKRIMREILQAVDHIHSRGLIHRDIKPENIMFHDTSKTEQTPSPMKPTKTIKLIDFDTCQEFAPDSPKVKHIVGTMGYIAPEALKGDYSPASDLWSVGVILYILMTGDMPFGIDVFNDCPSDTRCGSMSMNAMYSKLKDAHIDFECDPWPMFPQARDLCEQLLAFSPGDRSPSACAALGHPWLQY